MKIYTKTGDDGTTSLFDGTRVSKSHERVEIYGDVDELNSVVGIAISFVSDLSFKQQLQEIQKDLFALGSKLANPAAKKQKHKADFSEDKITTLEQQIDSMEESLAPMTSFILPGGDQAASFLHLARTVCRRAERKLVALATHEDIDRVHIIYLNRLSDCLFVCARFANFLEGKKDTPW